MTSDSFPRMAGAVAVAAVATLIASSLYYMVFGPVYEELRGVATAAPDPLTAVAQLGRNVVVAGVLVTLLRRFGITSRGGAVRVGLLLWLGFQAMAVLGSVIHEQYPAGLYLLHVGDALLTTMIMAVILGRKRFADSPDPVATSVAA